MFESKKIHDGDIEIERGYFGITVRRKGMADVHYHNDHVDIAERGDKYGNLFEIDLPLNYFTDDELLDYIRRRLREEEEAQS